LTEDYKIPVPIKAELRSYQQVPYCCGHLRLQTKKANEEYYLPGCDG
jgi:hypothetical protein